MPPATIAGVRLRSRPAQHAAIAITAVSTGATRSYIISSPDLGARLNSARSLSRVKKASRRAIKFCSVKIWLRPLPVLSISSTQAPMRILRRVSFFLSVRAIFCCSARIFWSSLAFCCRSRCRRVGSSCVRGRLAPYYHGTGLRARPRAKRELVIRLFL